MNASRRRLRLMAVWFVLVILVGIIVLIERTDLVGSKPPRSGQVGSRVRLLLPVPVDQLGAVEVIRAKTLHRFERDAAGAWFYHHHDVGTVSDAHHNHNADPALAERIASTLAAFGRTRIERQFALEPHAKDYGVMTPELLILVYRPLERQPLAQYAIGAIAPDTLSRYVLVVGRADVVTIPNYQIDNLLALIDAVARPSTSGHGAQNVPPRATPSR